MKTPSIRFVSFLITYLFVQLYSFGQPPSLVNFRGQLLNSGGQPVTSTVTIDLRVFPAQTGGTPLYLENVGSVEVRNGQYAFQFGSNGSPDFTSVIRQNSEAWVEITLNGDVLPRQRFVSVPYALSAGNAQVSPGSITRDMLSQDIQLDLNQTTNVAPGSITREMLAPGLLVDGNGSQIIAHGGGGSIDNPFGWDGEIITFTGTTYTVPSDKVLLIVSGDVIKLSSSEAFRQLNSGYSIVPPSTVINSEKGWTGILNDLIESITPIIIKDSPFQVPVGKNLVLTSAAYDISVSGKEVGWMNSRFIFIEQGSIINHSDGFYQSALSGYLIDEDISLGGGIPRGEGSVTTSMLSDTILKYLKPEITQQPLLNGQVNNGQSLSLSAQVEGKYLSYQWKRNGNNLNGATNATLTISDANASQHDGNYTLVVTNDFGSVETASIPVNVLVQPSTHTADLNGTVNLEMIWVDPGTFTMGSPTTEAGRSTNETEHNVTLTKGFYLGKYEVTQAQYEAVMTGNTDGLSATPSQYGGNPNLPVEQVSWDDVQVFLTRLNAQQSANIPAGWSYVLPTESQWEYACGAGTSTMYSWGNDINATQANYLSSGLSQTNDVGNYAANPWGFFDMHGNIWEWTADWYDATYPSGNPVIDPLGADSGTLRVARGGSWGSDGAYLRSAMRSHGPPSARSDSLGFRVGFKQQ